MEVPLAGCAAPQPKRYAWVTGLKTEKAAYYKQLRANPRPGVNQKLKECQIQNCSIYVKEIEGTLYLFSYVEYTGKDFDKNMKRMAADPETQRWEYLLFLRAQAAKANSTCLLDPRLRIL